ncbi:hypothetical protein DFS34DRAFT_280940 [Phlyctochytrium arcticum]|nr:hypothetical protein DFS34DRAFT_280940 [Phlyctochytrium arcticum]
MEPACLLLLSKLACPVFLLSKLASPVFLLSKLPSPFFLVQVILSKLADPKFGNHPFPAPWVLLANSVFLLSKLAGLASLLFDSRESRLPVVEARYPCLPHLSAVVKVHSPTL